MSDSRISVLLPTYGRATLLCEVLRSLARQSLPYDQFEVIVVDDGSMDNTSEVVRNFDSGLRIQYAYQDNGGIASAKNHALQLATSPILLFMDDDDLADEDLLAEHLKTHEAHPQENMAVLGFTGLGEEAACSPLMHFVTEVSCSLYGYPNIKHNQLLDYTYFWGGRTSCKRSLLLKYGMFDPVFRFGCEDIELGYRLSAQGLQVIYNSNARSTTIRAASLEEFCRRSERQGHSNWLFYRKHPVSEVEAWADVGGLPVRWAYFEPRLDAFMKSAAGLDAIARARLKYGFELDDLLVSLLHKSYWSVIDGYRVKGAWAASQQVDCQ
jgi:glycosyltransferase involved in cell wall biosynthesis